MPQSDSASSSRSSQPEPFRATAVEEPPLWSDLYRNLRDALFPPHLPPLELTSTPIPAADPMAAHTNPWAVGSATAVNGGILALLLCMGLGATHKFPPVPKGSPIDLSNFTLFAPATARSTDGGNGGGANDLIDPIKGRTPDRSTQTITPPQVPILDHPQLAINPTIAVPPDVKLPDNPSLPNIGVHASTNITLASNGPGGPTGIGWHGNGGDGPGNGNTGWGPGSGTGIYTSGVAGVTAPVPLFTPEAEFSDEARRQKYQGICIISLVVDTQGNPQAIHVVHPLGMGLDEKAVAAVQRYRFRPATKNGRPVPVRISVAVNFRLF
ncbi:MAG TPA: energy transducer TonB [Terracidiphilus sp.]|jgi:TonB family protein|nr:energy transducer TonB [Terracidiphilus sp.]